MATFESTYSETFTLPGSPEAVRAHFADLGTIIANTNDVESTDVDGDVVHFVLKAQEHMGIGTFQANYRCRYTVGDDGVLRWEPVGEGNSRQSGEATFTAKGDATEVSYSESIAVDMDVPKMMAPMLKPVIGAVLSHELKEYAKRMQKAFSA